MRIKEIPLSVLGEIHFEIYVATENHSNIAVTVFSIHLSISFEIVGNIEIGR